MDEKQKISIEEMAVFCKRKGFVYPNSEIYGGFSGFFDYGPLGVEIKNKIKSSWWKKVVHDREDVVGIDGATITNPKVWEASGHVASFEDILVECRKCHGRFRGDHLIGLQLNITTEGIDRDAIDKLIKDNHIKCPECGNELGNAAAFNLMFETYVGPKGENSIKSYLRPETAQLIFVNFKLVNDTTRMKLPFGIAQIGRAFRNEISPRDFLFRCREFEQMELEFFMNPLDKKCPFIDGIKDFKFNIVTRKEQEQNNPHKVMSVKQLLEKGLMEEWHAYWLKEMYEWFLELGVSGENLRLREHLKNELAHYAKACFDIEYKFPFGWKEIHGMANRGHFDLREHETFSQKDLSVFDEDTKQKIIPEVIEPSQGVDRAFLALMFEAYNYEKERDNVVLKLHKSIVPVQIGVFPLVNKLNDETRGLYEKLRKSFTCFFDKSGAIGRRYYRADEAGIPYCITYDFDSREDKAVTVRDRDSMKQERIKIDALEDYFTKLFRQ